MTGQSSQQGPWWAEQKATPFSNSTPSTERVISRLCPVKAWRLFCPLRRRLANEQRGVGNGGASEEAGGVGGVGDVRNVAGKQAIERRELAANAEKEPEEENKGSAGAEC